MEKALREAKVNTSWINPNTEYEAAFHNFLDAILDRSAGKPFLDQFHPVPGEDCDAREFSIRFRRLCLKIASPGLPDFYQGTEVWNFSLADPDNRRAGGLRPAADSAGPDFGPPRSEESCRTGRSVAGRARRTAA